MSPATLAATTPETSRRVPRKANTARSIGLAAGVALLLLVAVLSLVLGARSMPLATVVQALTDPTGSADHVVIRELRVPRTVLGIGTGAALGLAGALMQSLTRNPLADPGLLGIGQGAAFGVVIALALLGWSSPAVYVWFAFAGAALAFAAVYALGSAGRSGTSPVRLALAGVAMGAVLTAASSAVLRIDTETYDRMRFWMSGSLAGQGGEVVAQLVPFMAAGVLLGVLLAGPLNALALGDDAGRALGMSVGRTRLLAAVAITLLCGSATAAIGPVFFVGLAVPHAVRALVGPDQRWVLPFSALLAPILLLGSDIAGRLIGRPGEVQAGIVCAILGAPFFIALVRKGRLAAL
ncbi:Fe(3+)-siderophore ABC transporter permease [Spongiactinospora rosea]|uniref:Fe(3+)-siderophore ABC transporter permease n=1 Tax=Spongiactinospora rosea TaxID=2248750 RepID=A0A366M3H3_9ACTN|nr:iron chelate uptake ABC transporter family permease subunit [Spongiactinospora rosea]RBQ20134.1 Fe(3+)-siderophore ABC transporter permease [Spongiactinospora rosea]